LSCWPAACNLSTLLESDVMERKFSAPGVGLVMERIVRGDPG
jgi:hypothetical protein